MEVVNTGGPPSPPPNFRGFGGPRRRKGGFWGNFAAQSFGFKLNVIGSLLGLLLLIAYGVWLIWPKSSQAAAPPTSSAESQQPVMQNDLPTLTPTVTQPGQVTAFTSPVDGPTSTLVPLQGDTNPPPVDAPATATYQAAINRPAFLNNPAAVPYFIGVITYESGCRAANLGFTTSGYNGEPYYLYLRSPLDRDPLYQLVQITGVVQKMEGCDHPVIFVDQLFWMDQLGTPSPLATPTIVGTSTLTVTVTPAPWGLGTPSAKTSPSSSAPMPNADPTVYMPAPHDLPSLQTPLPTYTPYPTYTPIPKDIIIHTVIPHIPTQTPYPTYTPNPSTPTPLPANINGRVISVVGCPSSNLAIETGPGEHYFILLNGASLPTTGKPTDYNALAVGVLDTVCNGKAIKSHSITWYAPDPTATPTMTPEPTAEPTQEPTAEPTEEPTVEPTIEPTAEP